MRRLVLGAVLLAACARGEADPGPAVTGRPPVAVELADVLDTTLALPVEATGVVGAREELPLAFKIGGVVARVAVEDGQVVQAGQLLAELEQPEIGAEVRRAEAAAAQAARELARAQALFRDSVISRAALEGAATAAEVAQAGMEIARFNQRYAVIRAPAAGTVLRRMAEPGQQLSGGVPVLLFASGRGGQVVRVGLADRDAARVRVGDPAVVRFDDGRPEARARVTQVGAGALPGTGTFEVELALAAAVRSSAGAEASGLVARVRIEPRHTVRARVVPLAALLEGDGDSAVVWTMAPGATAAEQRVVRVAAIEGAWALIAAGLEDATQVVTTGAPYLDATSTLTLVGQAGHPRAD